MSNSIKKFSVTSKPLQEIANFDYATFVDRMAEGHRPGGLGGYSQLVLHTHVIVSSHLQYLCSTDKFCFSYEVLVQY